MERGNFHDKDARFVEERKQFMRARVLRSALRGGLTMEMRLYLKEKEMLLRLPFLEMLSFKSKSKKMPNSKEKGKICTPNSRFLSKRQLRVLKRRLSIWMVEKLMSVKKEPHSQMS